MPALRTLQRVLLLRMPPAVDGGGPVRAASVRDAVCVRSYPPPACAATVADCRWRKSITHAQQNRSSATGVHLAVLAPTQVRLLSIDELPPLDASRSAVLFPDDEAVAAEEVDVASISSVVVVDSKWGQARGVVASDKLRGVRHIRLRSYLTSYWRCVLSVSCTAPLPSRA